MPPKSHSAHTYGPGRSSTHMPSSCAAWTKRAMSRLPRREVEDALPRSRGSSRRCTRRWCCSPSPSPCGCGAPVLGRDARRVHLARDDLERLAVEQEVGRPEREGVRGTLGGRRRRQREDQQRAARHGTSSRPPIAHMIVSRRDARLSSSHASPASTPPVTPRRSTRSSRVSALLAAIAVAAALAWFLYTRFGPARVLPAAPVTGRSSCRASPATERPAARTASSRRRSSPIPSASRWTPWATPTSRMPARTTWCGGSHRRAR